MVMAAHSQSQSQRERERDLFSFLLNSRSSGRFLLTELDQICESSTTFGGLGLTIDVSVLFAQLRLTLLKREADEVAHLFENGGLFLGAVLLEEVLQVASGVRSRIQQCARALIAQQY
jgi:hypothetical protein